MKKKWYRILSSVCFLIFLAACKKTDIGLFSAEFPGMTRISFIPPIENHPFWLAAREGMAKECHRLGFNLDYVGPDIVNQDRQIELIEIAIASQVDGIVTSAVDPGRFDAVIRSSVRNGIPIVLIGSDSPGSLRTVFVGIDNVDAGRKAGNLMIESSGGKALIGVVTGYSRQLSLNQRIQGFTEAISEYPEMRIVTVEESGFDQINAGKRTKEILLEHPEVNAFLGVSTNDIEGIARIISEKSNSSSFSLIGFDDVDFTIESIKNGLVYGTIVQTPGQLGILSTEALAAVFSGGEVPESFIKTETRLITLENVKDLY